jgi:hypothetical protein
VKVCAMVVETSPDGRIRILMKFDASALYMPRLNWGPPLIRAAIAAAVAADPSEVTSDSLGLVWTTLDGARIALEAARASLSRDPGQVTP